MIIQAILLGIGVSMDAFAVSICNGLVLKENGRKVVSAFIFGMFHFLMPFSGFLVGDIFKSFVTQYAPWLAFLFFCFIGGRILFDRFDKKEKDVNKITIKIIFFQAFITAIDSLLVGITLVAFGYDIFKTLHTCIIISMITFAFCFFGGLFGGKLSILLGKKAENFGSVILILVGIRAFISRFF